MQLIEIRANGSTSWKDAHRIDNAAAIPASDEVANPHHERATACATADWHPWLGSLLECWNMTLTAVFALDGYEDDCSSIENCIARWSMRFTRELGTFYVYGYRAEGSVFYIGKGRGQRAWDQKKHTHPRFHIYVTSMLSAPYTVEILRDGLREEDAEELEQALISCFQRQLVNWVHGSHVPGNERRAYADRTSDVFARGRSAEQRQLWDTAATIYREFLIDIAADEQMQDHRTLEELRARAVSELAGRVDLYEREHLYKPHAPVVACEVLNRLTICLCKVGRPEEARESIELFQARYPQGAFQPYETFISGLGSVGTVLVTQRERSTLKRVERALQARARQNASDQTW